VSGVSVNSQPIVVADHCVRLAFLILEDQEDEIDDELDRVIEKLFGASLDDVLDSNWNAFQDEDWEFEAAANRAYNMGYDLRSAPNLPVQEWEYFWFMILAGERGWIAQTDEQRTEVRLKNDSEEFLNDRETIRLS
jgi:hypothetical protein